MHLVIPFAATGSAAGRQVQQTLALPRLRELLARLQPRPDAAPPADEWSFSPPHERLLARAWGWAGGDGLLPFAAARAAADGVDVGDLAWGLVTPTHWHLGTEQLSLIDPEALLLDEAGSRALFEAVQPLFTGDGFLLRWAAPLRWYAAHESLATMRCASLDRVIGRNVDPWFGSDPAARRLRRLQSEVQMLLHTHPLNAEREARGLLPVNSFWLSGCGVAQPVSGPPPVVDERLRRPALAEDWPGWARAWETLDAGPLAEALARLQRGQALTLSLCGDVAAITLVARPGGVAATLRRWFARPDPQALLETL